MADDLSDVSGDYRECVSDVRDDYKNKNTDIESFRQLNGDPAFKGQVSEACGDFPTLANYKDSKFYDPSGEGPSILEKLGQWKDELLSQFGDKAQNDSAHVTLEDKNDLIGIMRAAVEDGHSITSDQYNQLKDLQSSNDPVWSKDASNEGLYMYSIEQSMDFYVPDHVEVPNNIAVDNEIQKDMPSSVPGMAS
ncbi:MAG: hypothetical protein ACRBDI_04475 [Alphaproteobacteria bacterium]